MRFAPQDGQTVLRLHENAMSSARRHFSHSPRMKAMRENAAAEIRLEFAAYVSGQPGAGIVHCCEKRLKVIADDTMEHAFALGAFVSWERAESSDRRPLGRRSHRTGEARVIPRRLSFDLRPVRSPLSEIRK
jgi:hypothetical protein